MFELYTERARRVLFFARYEASQLGSIAIETEHLLLGLVREAKGLTSRIFKDRHVSLDELRREIEGGASRTQIPTSVEIPFSAATKRALQSAANEAAGLLHNYIGTEHLLLGLLREADSTAARLLGQRGIRLETVRAAITEMRRQSPIGPDRGTIADSRTYAIKRTQRTGPATTVAIVVGKEAAIRAIDDYDHRLTADERAAGWEHHFEPAGDAPAGAATPPSADPEA